MRCWMSQTTGSWVPEAGDTGLSIYLPAGEGSACMTTAWGVE